MFKRKLHKMLSEGEGRQLFWLLIVTVASFIVFTSIVKLFFPGWNFSWQDIIALYLDAGNFSGAGEHDWLRLIIAFVGMFVFSALLISVFTNVFDNVASAYRKGEARYRFRDHVLILGGGNMLDNILIALHNNADYADKDIVVMTTSEVELLRDKMETVLSDKHFSDHITYYHGERDTRVQLESACPQHAAVIYIIGEDNEPAHDTLSIRCNDLLSDICGQEGEPLTCYLTLEQHTSINVFMYMKNHGGGHRLQTEVVNNSEYVVEQLLVNTDLLPALHIDDPQHLHIVAVGGSFTTRSFAKVAAQICHYPNFPTAGRTRITFIDGDMRRKMDDFVANNQSLFDLSHYRYVSPTETEEHQPKDGYGDFLDVEWEFLDSRMSSPFVRQLLKEWATDPMQKLVIAVCYDDPAITTAAALHLPSVIYEKGTPIAVYQKEHTELIDKAKATGMYGRLICFGEATPSNDSLFIRQAEQAKRVNYLYDKEFGRQPSANEGEAWNKLSHAHKRSSIASANSIALKLRSFDLEPTRQSIDALDHEMLESLSEVEHRRWMLTMLMMGYQAAKQKDRRDRTNFDQLKREHFIHLDIAPYDELPHIEQKDLFIVKNIPYIIKKDRMV